MSESLTVITLGIALTSILALALWAGPLGVAVGLGVYALVWLGVEVGCCGE